MQRSCPPVVLYLCVLVIVATGQAQAQSPPMAQQVLVGIKEAPPFAMKQADTTWEGISVELWRAIAQDLQLSYAWRERDLRGLLQGVAEGALDVAIGALTITADREKQFDFTHPFYITGLAIAVPAQPSVGLVVRVQRFLARPFLEFVAWLGLVLLGVGTLIWLCEHRRNAQQFGGGVLRGLRSGVWWAAVTMATVGYGDKVPTTRGGQVVGVLWMLSSLVLAATVIASITAALTVAELTPRVRGPEAVAQSRMPTRGTDPARARARGAGRGTDRHRARLDE